ncbi:uncharacterized protein LOC135499377 [Lineus longissimus]|uniref:uncharacterized protein LOC135499377 n=1 Tax=Lineus longissimus TaxID=88925 RepID=UPI00315D2DBD
MSSDDETEEENTGPQIVMAERPNLKPPAPLALTGNISANWRRWKQKFTIFLTASRITEEPIKVALLLHSIGDEGLEVFNSFGLPDDVEYAPLIQKFEEYCTPQKNVTFERHRFNSRIQQEGESFDCFLTDIKIKAKDCEFDTLRDSLIKDRIVFGIRMDRTRERLLREKELTLTKAIDICRAAELTKEQMSSLSNGQRRDEQTDKTVNAVGRQGYNKAASGYHNQSTYKGSGAKCGNCGTFHQPRQCPAYGKQCKGCKRLNHFIRCCRSTNKQVHSVEEEDDDGTYESLFIGSINQLKGTDESDQQWLTKLKMGQRQVFVNLKIDTGAQANVLPYDLFKRICNKRDLIKTKIRLTTYDGTPLPVAGSCRIRCIYKDNTFYEDFVVVDKRSDPVLGLRTSVKMNLLQRIDALNRPTSDSECILDEYKDIFEGLGCLDVPEHHIEIDPSVKPVIHAPRKFPIAMQDRFKTQLDRLVGMNVLKKVDEPTDWVNSIVLVEKSDKSLRICLDPKDLNTAVKREHFPLITLDEISTKLAGAKYFTVLDASNGFWQQKLDTESSMLTTFNTCFGRYRFLRLPFGISSSAEVFNKAVTQILENLEGVISYIDDLLVWGRTKEEHDERLRKVLDRLREKGLKLNRRKCRVGLSEVVYIGGLLSADGVKPDPQKVQAIVDMPQPDCKAALRRFLGLVTYFGKYLPNLSDITSPLRQLLPEDAEWAWLKQQSDAVAQLKTMLTTAPTLKFYDVTKPVTLTVDAETRPQLIF